MITTIENAQRELGVGQNKAITNPHATTKPAKAHDYPDPATVKGRTLGALLRGERLTHLDCWQRFGSARLSHHIYCLRGTPGWSVLMVEQTVTTTDAGRPASIGVYYLDPEVIAAAGERGQRYAEECARVEAERRARDGH
jgi:hypothetical protein